MDMTAWIIVVFYVIICASFWKIFDRAGRPGWAGLIPVYNLYVLMGVIGRSGWFVLLYLVPLVNLFWTWWTMWELGRRFGRGAAFRIGLALLAVVFLPILALSSDHYLAEEPAPA